MWDRLPFGCASYGSGRVGKTRDSAPKVRGWSLWQLEGGLVRRKSCIESVLFDLAMQFTSFRRER